MVLSCLRKLYKVQWHSGSPSTCGASSHGCPFTNTLSWTAASKFCTDTNTFQSWAFVFLQKLVAKIFLIPADCLLINHMKEKKQLKKLFPEAQSLAVKWRIQNSEDILFHYQDTEKHQILINQEKSDNISLYQFVGCQNTYRFFFCQRKINKINVSIICFSSNWTQVCLVLTQTVIVN